jgi:ketosteroid isomerase-like protein
MKRVITILALTILSVTSAFAQKYGNAQQQLINLDKEWAAATARGDATTLNRILANDYTFTDLDGSVGTKAQLLRDIKANSRISHAPLETDDYVVRLFGHTAVMTHSSVASDQGSTTLLRSLHVWVKRGRSWQAPRLACAKYSFEPEVMAYFGDSNTVIKKLDNDQMGLPNRRGYLLLIETKDSAEFSFFEREDEQHFKVYQWNGASLGDLREQLTNVILENRGIACIGAQTKSIVKARFSPTDMGTIPMPLSARAAFSHMLKKYGDQYLRVTILLLC